MIMCAEFRPMRSLIYVDCVKEQYRVKLRHWLYKYHVPDSISHFEPYCTKILLLPCTPNANRPGKIWRCPYAAHRTLLAYQ